jgi:hypothetical protein
MPVSNKGNPQHYLGSFTVATAPTTTTHPHLTAGDLAYFTNALNASETTGNGTGNMAFWNGSNWKRVDTGANIGA